jgi:hypothetical protein
MLLESGGVVDGAVTINDVGNRGGGGGFRHRS